MPNNDAHSTPAPWQINEIPVRTALAPYVGTLYEVRLPKPKLASHRIIAMATPSMDLVLNLGDSFNFETFGDSLPVKPGLYLAGPRPSTAFVRPEGELHLLGIRFKHGAVAPLLPYPAKELEQRFVPLAALWPDTALSFDGAMAKGKAIGDLARRLETLLISLFQHAKKPDALIRKSVKLIAQRQGDIEVSALAEALSVSRQTVKHKFDQHVGLGPKLYGKLRRFQSVLQRLAVDHKPDWTHIAEASGYYDQAHLIREFNHFTGFSPQKFLRNLEKGEDLYLFDSADQTLYHLNKRSKPKH